MADKSAATQVVKVTDWDAYAADRHADKLRQTRQRLRDRVAVLSEFGMDSMKIADEITRLRQEIEKLTGDLATAHAQLDMARDVVRPLVDAIDCNRGWPEVSDARDAAAEWLAGQGVAV